MNFSNFTAPTFLFLFLPVVLAVYFVTPRALRNAFLLVASIIFYAEGEKFYTLIMVFSIAFNYATGLLLDGTTQTHARKFLLVIAVAVNLALIAAFKYADFLTGNLNVL